MTISLISSSVSGVNKFFVTSKWIIYLFSLRPYFKVPASLSSILLHDMSMDSMFLLSVMYFDKLSQNMLLRRLAARFSFLSFDCFECKSMHILEPALSSSLFNFRFNDIKEEFTLRA